ADAARQEPEGRGGAHDQHERPDHVGQEAFVLLALDLERLPQLAAALLGGRLAGRLRLGLGGLYRSGITWFRHLFRIRRAATRRPAHTVGPLGTTTERVGRPARRRSLSPWRNPRAR